MDRITKIVLDIVARCKYEGVDVSETLAAFVARTVRVTQPITIYPSLIS